MAIYACKFDSLSDVAYESKESKVSIFIFPDVRLHKLLSATTPKSFISHTLANSNCISHIYVICSYAILIYDSLLTTIKLHVCSQQKYVSHMLAN